MDISLHFYYYCPPSSALDVQKKFPCERLTDSSRWISAAYTLSSLFCSSAIWVFQEGTGITVLPGTIARPFTDLQKQIGVSILHAWEHAALPRYARRHDQEVRLLCNQPPAFPSRYLLHQITVVLINRNGMVLAKCFTIYKITGISYLYCDWHDPIQRIILEQRGFNILWHHSLSLFNT